MLLQILYNIFLEVLCRVCYSLSMKRHGDSMKKYLETTKNLPSHTYLLDATKRLCYGYIKEGTKTPFMFTKPLRFDPRQRTFQELK